MSRVVAGAVDAAVIFGIYVGVLAVVGIVRFLLTDEKLHMPRPDPLVTVVVIGILAVIVLSTAWSGNGRTIGDDVVGLRVVTASGGDVTSGGGRCPCPDRRGHPRTLPPPGARQPSEQRSPRLGVPDGRRLRLATAARE